MSKFDQVSFVRSTGLSVCSTGLSMHNEVLLKIEPTSFVCSTILFVCGITTYAQRPKFFPKMTFNQELFSNCV